MNSVGSRTVEQERLASDVKAEYLHMRKIIRGDLEGYDPHSHGAANIVPGI